MESESRIRSLFKPFLGDELKEENESISESDDAICAASENVESSEHEESSEMSETEKLGIENRKKLTPFQKGVPRSKDSIEKMKKTIREKRALKESLQGLLYSKLPPKMRKAYEGMGYEIPADNTVTHLEFAAARCLTKAMSNGDYKALIEITKMAGLHMEESKLIVDNQNQVQRTVVELHLGKKPENKEGDNAVS